MEGQTVCLVLYGIYYLVLYMTVDTNGIYGKKKKKKQNKTQGSLKAINQSNKTNNNNKTLLQHLSLRHPTVLHIVFCLDFSHLVPSMAYCETLMQTQKGACSSVTQSPQKCGVQS